METIDKCKQWIDELIDSKYWLKKQSINELQEFLNKNRLIPL